MILKLNPASGVPIYLQLMEQIKHAIEIGALRAGDQLPAIRKIAEDLVMNANTVAKAYRELEHEGAIELRQGSGAFVAERAARAQTAGIQKGRSLVRQLVDKLQDLGLAEDQMRRLFEAELAEWRANS